MKQYLDKEILESAKLHALQEFPLESCGIVVEEKYIPCTNIADNPTVSFQIKPDDYINLLDKIDFILHSHDNFPHASKKDMIDQEKLDIPYGIINIQNGAVQDVFFWGDKLPIQNYVGRQFFSGAQDCYSLCRDYYREELGIILPIYPRDYGWWLSGKEELIMDNLKDCGFIDVGNNVKDIKPNDAILAKINSPVVNHTGLFIGNGLILHHLCLRKNSLSRREPLLALNSKWIYTILRYKDFM